MDTTFWIGIFLGAVISMIASFFANLYTDNVREYLSRRRQVKLSSKKANELKTYAFVKNLTLGEPVAVLEMQRRNSSSSALVSMATMTIAIAIFIAVDPGTMNKFLPHLIIIVLLITGLLSLSMFLATSLSNAATLRKAKDLARYENDIRANGVTMLFNGLR